MNAVTKPETAALAPEAIALPQRLPVLTDPLEQQCALEYALACAQLQYLPIENNCSANVRPKDRTKAGYTFRYADLAEILTKTRRALAINGLTFKQPIRHDAEKDALFLDTILAHIQGGREVSTVPLPHPANRDPEDFANVLERYRRYCARAALGVSSADPEMPLRDTDDFGDEAGSGGDGWPPTDFRDPDGASVPHRPAAAPAPREQEDPPRRAPRTEHAALLQPPASPAPAMPSRPVVEPLPDDAQLATEGEVKWLLAAAKRHNADVPALLRELYGIALDPELSGLTKGQFRTLKSRLVSL